MKASRLIDLNGEWLSFREISQRTGINLSTLRQRWRQGKQGEALIAPVDRSEAGRLAAQARVLPPDDPLLERAMTCQEVALELGVSPNQVRWLERNALRKLRKMLEIDD